MTTIEQKHAWSLAEFLFAFSTKEKKMQVQINEDMKFAFAEQITTENINEIADAIKEYSGSELEVKVYDTTEIDIDNKTFSRLDVAVPGDWIVINKSEIGYFIYLNEAEMEAVWHPIV